MPAGDGEPLLQPRGYVLAGGQSRRMGQDKAFVLLSGKPLIQIAVERLNEVCSEVRILSGTSSSARAAALSEFAGVIPDATPELGPLAGVLAALTDTGMGWCLITAVDQPLVTSHMLSDWLQWAMQQQEISASWLCETPCNQANLEHLPVLLHTRLLPILSRVVQSGERKLMQAIQLAIQQQNSQFLAFPVNGGTDWTLNLNTPADVDRAQRIVEQYGPNQNAAGASE